MRTITGDRGFGLASGLALLVASALLAGAASAQQHTYPLLQGVWARGDGVEVDVPFVGRALGNCNFLAQGYNTDRPAGSDTTNFPTTHPSVYAGFMRKIAQNYGCPSGTQASFTAMSHAVGAQFTLPTHVISRPVVGPVAVPIPNNDSLIQAETDALWQIPHSTRGTGMDAIGAISTNGMRFIGPTMASPGGCVEATCTNLPVFRRFEQSAWQNQTGRVGADFTWCPGDKDEATPCTTLGQNDNGDGRIIKYKGGPNAFGGTIAQIVDTQQDGSLFIQLPTQVIVNILDAGDGSIQALGRGYADFLTDPLPAATQAFTMVSVAPHYKSDLMKTVTLITMVGNPAVPAFPSNINEKYGFPLTTGTVVARRITNVGGNPVVTITGMGFDRLFPTRTRQENNTTNTTANPQTRHVSLVAGSLSNLSLLGTNTVGMGQLDLVMPEPDHTGQLLAGVLALLAVGAWRARGGRA